MGLELQVLQSEVHGCIPVGAIKAMKVSELILGSLSLANFSLGS